MKRALLKLALMALVAGCTTAESSQQVEENSLDLHAEAKQELQENVDPELTEFRNYLEKKGVDMCQMSQRIDDIGQTIRDEASKKYGDIPQGLEATKEKSAYIERRQEKEHEKLEKELQLGEHDISKVVIFALKHCK